MTTPAGRGGNGVMAASGVACSMELNGWSFPQMLRRYGAANHGANGRYHPGSCARCCSGTDWLRLDAGLESA